MLRLRNYERSRRLLLLDEGGGLLLISGHNLALGGLARLRRTGLAVVLLHVANI